MTAERGLRRTAIREAAILLWFILGSLLILPVAVYYVGQFVFGDYPGGLGAFLRYIGAELATLDPGTWFLILSPYLVWQVARATWRGLRRRRPTSAPEHPAET